MAKPSVYIETTVVSYLTARPSTDVVRLAHEILTREWWSQARATYDLYTSIFTTTEASGGDPSAAQERVKALQDIPLLPIGSDVAALASALEQSLKLPSRARIDAAHVAVAAVNGVAILVTWNCRHLANWNFTPKIEEVCKSAGFVAPRILTPELLMVQP
jgi:hypothetical protein